MKRLSYPICICTVFLCLVFNSSLSAQCDVYPLSISPFTCDDNGTPGDPSDDTFTLDVVMTNNGAPGTDFTFVGSGVIGSGSYGQTETVGPFNLNDAPFTMGFQDVNNPNCVYNLFLDPGPNCSNPSCAVTSRLENYVCDDNGTADPFDDTFVVDLIVEGLGDGVSNGYTTSGFFAVSGTYGVPQTVGPFSVITGVTGVQVTDNGNPDCFDFATVFSPGSCSSTCSIDEVIVEDITCFSNGTSTPDDDVFTFIATVNGTNTSSGWTSNDPFNNFGSYGAPDLFGPFLIADGPYIITFTDNDDPSCTFVIVVTPPPPCSVPQNCVIQSFFVQSVTCNENGTPSDPSDDFYDLVLNPTGSGLGSDYIATSSLGPLTPTSAPYGAPTTFQTPPGTATTGNFTITLTDADDPSCSNTITIDSPPSSCSNQPLCDIFVLDFIGPICNDNGTPNDPNDDTFTFTATIFGAGNGPGWTADDPNNTTGSYASVVTFGPYPISGGGFTVTITDNTNPVCTVSFDVNSPTNCSVPTSCSIQATPGVPICNHLGTNDPSDDEFGLPVLIIGSNTSALWSADDPDSTMGGYGFSHAFGPFLISDGSFVLTITDVDDPNCTTSVTIVPPAPCSSPPPCSIEANAGTPVCDDNGTPNDTSDDTFTFTVLVSGSNTGAFWSADDPNATIGGYGNSTTFGPYPISDGDLTITVTDSDDASCTSTFTVSAPPTCSVPPPCSIEANAGTPICDDNGTPNDPSDDTYTFTVLVSGSNTGAFWSADDPNATVGGYGNNITFGPYLISDGDLTITVTDSDDASCTSTFTVAAPPTCSVPPPCSIAANAGTPVCDDNGTPNDTSDDTYTFTVLVSGSNTGAFWSADDPNATVGGYGNNITFGPYLISDGDLTITVTDLEDASCTSTFTVTPPPTCSVPPPCSIAANAGTPVCDDNGTPNDASDDTYTFTVLVSGSNTGAFWSADDPNATVGGYGSSTTFGPYLISDGDLTITVTDSEDASCTSTFSVSAPPTCSVPPPCSIEANAGTPVCDDNGTPNDASDDTYTFTVLVSGSNTGAFWSADDPNATIGGYGNNTTFGPYPISDGDLTITVTDSDDASCTSTFTVSAPPTCSVPPPCSIAANAGTPVCDDNGTPNDASDDTFTFTVLVSGSNTGAFWSADDPNATIGGYGNSTTFGPYLISNGDLTITVTDSEDASCTSTFTVSAPPTCSVPPPCSIAANAGTPVCDDNGTPNDASDDTFTFSVLVSGSNTGAFWSADDPNATVGGYGSNTTFGPYLISDGDLTVTVTDSDDGSCTSTFTITPPPTCSVPPPCSIEANAGTPICDDNGTPNDSSDDTYTFTVLVSGSNTGAFWSADDPNGTVGGYGTGTTFGPYLISNGDLTITVTDSDDGSCTSTFMVTPPPPCSVPPPCSIAANAGTPICDDNGTPNDSSDDTYTFTVLVSGSNTGAFWSADDPNGTVGGYGTGTTFGPYLISNGDLTITVTDSDDGSCTSTFMVTPPPPCSVPPPCSIAANAGTPVCDDNGTPNDPSDDTYTFTVLVSGSNTGAFWSADDPNATVGGYGNNTTFGPYLISDGDLTITVTDSDDASCTSTFTVSAPPTCSVPPPCSIEASAGTPVCDDNGTPNDTSDDTYTFTVLVSGSNTGAFWSADDPNATVGGYGNNITFGPYLISDGDLTIMVTDSDDPSCTSTFTVTAPPTCSVPPPCSIEANAGTPVCDDNGTPNDASDDTYTFTVLVSGSNTGAFWSADDPNTTVGGYESSTTFGPYLISDGDLTVTVTDSEDASCTSTFTVAAPPTCSVPPPCSIAANAGTPICDDNGTPNDASDDSFTFTVLVSGSNTGAFWSADDPNATIGGYGNNTTFGPYLISNGDLTITVTDSEDASCTSTFSVSAPPTCSVPPPCSIEANAGTPICDDNGTPNDASDDTYTFTVLVSGSNTGASWSADDPNATVGGYGISTTFGPYLISDGDLTITVTDSEDGGCTNTFTVTAPPTCSVCNVFVDAGPDRLISCDQPEAELIGIAVGAESASWTNAAGDTVGSSNEVNIDEAGSYIFSAVFPNGCTDSDTMVVISDQEAPLAIIFADPDSLLNCVATSLELTSPGESGVIYNWETDDGMVQTDALQVTQEGTYSLIALDTLNGCSSSASISIPDFTDFPFIDLEPEVVLDCEDGRITLDASGSQSGPSIQYQWLDEDGIPIPNADQNELTVSEPGIYFLTLTDVNNGCENTDTVQVEPSSTVSVMLPAEVQINQNDPFLLEGSTNLNEDEIARIFWTPGELVTCDTCLSTRVLNIEDQRFTLFVESIDGCLGSASTFVRRLPRAAVYVPNGFSPNDDGVNDRLRPFANEQVERIDLFLMADRWGNTVFRIEDVLPDDPALEWNGRFREQLVPVAVYVYYLRVRLDTGETLELKGDVTLVR